MPVRRPSSSRGGAPPALPAPRFRIDAVFLELAVKGRTTDSKPPRHFAHLAVIVFDGEADHLQLDIGERPDIAALVEQAEPAEAAWYRRGLASAIARLRCRVR